MNPVAAGSASKCLRGYVKWAVIVVSAFVLGRTVATTHPTTVLALVIFTLTVIASLADMRAGMILAIAGSYFMPFLSRLMLGATATVLKPDLLAAGPDVLLGIVGGVYIVNMASSRHLARSGRLTRVILVFVLLSIVQVFNPAKSISTGFYGARVDILPIVMYFVGRDYLQEDFLVHWVLRAVMTFSLLDMGYAFYQYFVGYPAWDQAYLAAFPDVQRMMIWEGTHELVGFRKLFSMSGGSYDLQYPLALFGILLASLPGNALSRDTRLLRICYFLSLGFLFALGIERTPLAMFLVGLFASAAIRLGGKWARLLLLSSLVCVALYAVGGSWVRPYLMQSGSLKLVRLGELFDPFNASTLQSRAIQIWPLAWAYIKESPLLGYGVGSATQSAGGRFGELLIAPHNWYLKVWLELGAGGLFLLIVLIILCLDTASKAARNPCVGLVTRYVATGFWGAIIAVLLAAVANIPLEYHLAIFFWLLVGFVARDQERSAQHAGSG